MGKPLLSVLLTAFLLTVDGVSISISATLQDTPPHPGESHTGATPDSARPGPQNTFVKEDDSETFSLPSRSLQHLPGIPTTYNEMHHIKFMDWISLEGLLLFMEEALEELKRHLEGTTSQQEDSPNSSAVSRGSCTDSSWECSAASSLLLSRHKRTDFTLYPFYIVRNIITLIQVTLVLTRGFIVVGEYFYNRINANE